jgi:hypothetical protein
MVKLAEVQGSAVVERAELMECLTLTLEQLLRSFIPEGKEQV